MSLNTFGHGSFEYAHHQAAERSFDFRSTVVVIQSDTDEDIYYAYDNWYVVDESRIVAVYINGMRFQRVMSF